jgi:hypothetical protein
MTVKSALFVVFGLLLALVGLVVTQLNLPIDVANDSTVSTLKTIGGFVCFTGIVLFAVGALSKGKNEN